MKTARAVIRAAVISPKVEHMIDEYKLIMDEISKVAAKTESVAMPSGGHKYNPADKMALEMRRSLLARKITNRLAGLAEDR